jgi:hypothetical protein
MENFLLTASIAYKESEQTLPEQWMKWRLLSVSHIACVSSVAVH